MALGQFVREYRTVRRAEGWGSHEPEYYRALPYRDLTRRFEAIWRIRARSYDVFVHTVLRPLELGGSLRILDLGAGSGWLAYRLRQRGHHVLAMDLLEDDLDGLGAIAHYTVARTGLWPVVAEFDRLPLPDAQADIAIFNASLHYSTDYCRTLRESLRVLGPRGTLVILDSPMYSDPNSGVRMVHERETRFRATYGFASDALPHEHFLTPQKLATVAEELHIHWQIFQPRLDPRTTVSRRFNGLRARREPASFPVVVGTRA
jgi:SAM-dependent methyltransferase